MTRERNIPIHHLMFIVYCQWCEIQKILHKLFSLICFLQLNVILQIKYPNGRIEIRHSTLFHKNKKFLCCFRHKLVFHIGHMTSNGLILFRFNEKCKMRVLITVLFWFKFTQLRPERDLNP